MAPPRQREIIIVADAQALAEAAAKRLMARIRANPGRIAICLTGGSGPKRLYELLATPAYAADIPWDRTHWFIGDERFVPQDDALNNINMARRAFLNTFSSPEFIHQVPTNAANPDAAAKRYETMLQSFYGGGVLDPARPLFDLVLMGIGPDGHTASLFPGYPAIAVRDRWVVGVARAHVAPFVPRVTLTLPALSSCREMLFLLSGVDKRDIAARVLSDDTLPAAQARSQHETVWLIDKAASPDGSEAGGSPQRSAAAPCALIVMGVSGSGKSTIAEKLAGKMNWTYEDGDKFHPKANVDKMKAGHPLTDADREPWLQAIADEIDRACAAGEHVIIACSALKRAYRDTLVHGRDDVRIVYLDGSRALIADRLARRKGHFMPAGLLESQFDALEPPAADEKPMVVQIDASVDAIVNAIADKLGAGAEVRE